MRAEAQEGHEGVLRARRNEDERSAKDFFLRNAHSAVCQRCASSRVGVHYWKSKDNTPKDCPVEQNCERKDNTLLSLATDSLTPGPRHAGPNTALL